MEPRLNEAQRSNCPLYFREPDISFHWVSVIKKRVEVEGMNLIKIQKTRIFQLASFFVGRGLLCL